MKYGVNSNLNIIKSSNIFEQIGFSLQYYNNKERMEFEILNEIMTSTVA